MIVLFDLDGTLTDSAPGIVAGFRHALASVGAPEPSAAVLAKVVGPPMIDTFRELGLDEAQTARALDAYFDRYGTVGWAENRVYDGIEAVLSALSLRGMRLGVATSKREHYAVQILEHFGLAGWFEFIGGASDDLTRREKADVIAHTLAHMGIEAVPDATAGVTMVGDRDHDVKGAARWGIPTVYAGWGYGGPGESDGAVFIADTVADVGR